jgi:hypothetical protein
VLDTQLILRGSGLTPARSLAQSQVAVQPSEISGVIAVTSDDAIVPSG